MASPGLLREGQPVLYTGVSEVSQHKTAKGQLTEAWPGLPLPDECAREFDVTLLFWLAHAGAGKRV